MTNNFWLGCPKPVTRTYITLKEIAEATHRADNWNSFWLSTKMGFYQFLNDDLGFYTSLDTPYTKELFSEYIWPEFRNSVLIYIDDASESTGEFHNQIAAAWDYKRGLIYRWLNETKPIYEILIANLEANKSKLLDAIKTSTNTRFNDTPQEPGVFTEDEYTSSITATESATDAGTLMSRLKEIEDDLRSLYGKWANEFSRFIIYSAI